MERSRISSPLLMSPEASRRLPRSALMTGVGGRPWTTTEWS
ncbi:MAG: hypothetical protein AAF604_12830 [Acidobacteriota bacterium]